MTLTVIFKVIDIGENTFSADFRVELFEGHFSNILPQNILFSKFALNGDGQEIQLRKYLKTVDFIKTKTITFKINPFLPPRISSTNYMTLKVKVIIH